MSETKKQTITYIIIAILFFGLAYLATGSFNIYFWKEKTNTFAPWEK